MRQMSSADDIDSTSQSPPPRWREALERSEADLAAGRLVPGKAVMQRLRQTIAEMETEEEQHAATPIDRNPGR
jgi:hypothetical protein